MTKPDLMAELAEVAELLAVTTGGEWTVAPKAANNKVTIMSGCARVANISVTNIQWRDNARLIARAVNFLRTHHAELEAVMRDARHAEALRYERDAARARNDRAVQILCGIHALLYPEPVEVDGKVYVFRPSSPDPHEVLQALSDRIRAIPDEIAAMHNSAREG